MSLLNQVLALCIFSGISLEYSEAWESFENDKIEMVHLGVYYESLCPDSENFVVDQLLPQVMLHPELLKIKFVPFGKAKSVSAKNFRCQHGPRECAGNLFQDCALNLMQNQTDLDRTKYVACELKTRSSVYGKYKCVIEAKVSPVLVKECIYNGHGTYLQKISEKETFRVQKPLNFVPTITIDGVFDQHIQDLSMANLKRVLLLKFKSKISTL